MTVVNQFILKVGGQDDTGLLNLFVLKNDFEIPFTFNRTDVGVFECPEFDNTKHFIRSNINAENCKLDILEQGGGFKTTNGGNLYDYAFEIGGFIIIEEVINNDYTPQELAVISECKALLYASNSDSLIQIANSL